MRFHTENEFDNFDFRESYLQGIVQMSGSFRATIDQVKIKPENSKNRDIRMMRTNNLELHIADAVVTSIVEEGVKIYNADEVLQQEIPDRVLDEGEYTDLYQRLEGCEIYNIEKKDGTYLFSIDGEERSYLIHVQGSGDTQDWDRFMNLEQM